MLTASILKRKGQCKTKIKLSADDPGFKSAKNSVIPWLQNKKEITRIKACTETAVCRCFQNLIILT